jgi:hypothetical protein
MKAARRFRAFMLISAALYAIGGLSFAVSPGESFGAWDRRIRKLFGLGWEDIPAVTIHHWTVLAISMMATITVCSLLAARDPVRNRDFAVPVMVSKAVSTLGALILLATEQPYGAYLLVIATDFPLLALTWWFWRAADREATSR